MSKFAKIEGGIVSQVQPDYEEGFIEVADEIHCGMLQDEEGNFSEPVIPRDIEAENEAKFLAEWSSLKIGYNLTSKVAYRIKYGKELAVDGLEPDTLYNIDDMKSITAVPTSDHVYLCNEAQMRNIAYEISILSVTGSDIWRDPVGGRFETDVVELNAVLLKAGQVKKLVDLEIFGA